ncbi:MAG: cysteine desulfurase family protein [Desulfonatronovibrio sp.]|nr:cysteine desulfurase [Desulfovibrionales bacterium]
MQPLYFDYNATTPVHETVIQSMLPCFREKFGNPGCAHTHGLQARRIMEQSRIDLARLINAEPHQIYFTSCATESNNLVLSGLLCPGDELIISAVEHPSIIMPARELVKKGIKLKIAPVDHNGLIDPDQVLDMVSSRTKLISIMLSNNETGAIQPLAHLGRELKSRNILFHTDAAQAAGKIPVDIKKLGTEFLTIAGHKMYAPKGISALYIGDHQNVSPILFGGGQEKAVRPGTENIPYIAGLGQASIMALSDLDSEMARQEKLGNKFIQGLSMIHQDFILHAENAPRLPATMSIGFGGYRAGDILSGMVACSLSASAGAACHGEVQKMSSVLKAMNTDPFYGLGTIRFSWGRMTSEQDMDELLNRLEYIFKSFLKF